MTCLVNLPGFPEWAIPMTKVVPKAYTEDAFMSGTVTWNVYCRHLWQVIPSGNPAIPSQIILRLDIEASATIPGEGNNPVSIPVYVDIDLVFFNERTGNQINSNKV